MYSRSTVQSCTRTLNDCRFDTLRSLNSCWHAVKSLSSTQLTSTLNNGRVDMYSHSAVRICTSTLNNGRVETYSHPAVHSCTSTLNNGRVDTYSHSAVHSCTSTLNNGWVDTPYRHSAVRIIESTDDYLTNCDHLAETPFTQHSFSFSCTTVFIFILKG